MIWTNVLVSITINSTNYPPSINNFKEIIINKNDILIEDSYVYFLQLNVWIKLKRSSTIVDANIKQNAVFKLKLKTYRIN